MEIQEIEITEYWQALEKAFAVSVRGETIICSRIESRTVQMLGPGFDRRYTQEEFEQKQQRAKKEVGTLLLATVSGDRRFKAVREAQKAAYKELNRITGGIMSEMSAEIDAKYPSV